MSSEDLLSSNNFLDAVESSFVGGITNGSIFRGVRRLDANVRGRDNNIETIPLAGDVEMHETMEEFLGMARDGGIDSLRFLLFYSYLLLLCSSSQRHIHRIELN